MKLKLLILLGISCGFALGAEPAGEASSPEALLNAAVANPGSYSQMCDMQLVDRKATPLPIYGLMLDSEFQLSVEVLRTLRSRRSEIIPSLAKRLAELDLMRDPQVSEMKFKDGSGTDIPEEIASTGLDPKALSQILLKIVIDLNATECLPGLLKLEKELSQKLEAHAADPTQPLPEIQSDAGFILGSPTTYQPEFQPKEGEEFTPEENAKIAALHKRVAAIVAQRDLLATMLCLLRQEKFGPLLKSNFESSFAKSVKAAAKEENLAAVKKPADIAKDEADYLGFDPILNLPTYPGRKATDVKYNSEVRQQVLDLVNEFLKTVPAEKRLGAKGMTPRVYVR